MVGHPDCSYYEEGSGIHVPPCSDENQLGDQLTWYSSLSWNLSITCRGEDLMVLCEHGQCRVTLA